MCGITEHIQVCKDALAKGWVNKEDLEGCMPNVIQVRNYGLQHSLLCRQYLPWPLWPFF